MNSQSRAARVIVVLIVIVLAFSFVAGAVLMPQ